ncbi:hypothetical protein D3C85_1084590 [compost metagenome]
MRRQGRDPEQGLGDVLAGHRLRAAVEGVGRRLIAAGADQGELSLGHARFDGGDAHPRPVQVRPQAQRELAHEGLGAAIGVSALVGIASRNRADVQDGAPARDQARQQAARDRDQSGDVGVDHLTPLIQIGVLGGGGAQRQPGVVDQDVDVAKALGQGVQGRVDGGLVADVEDEGMDHVGAQLSHQFVQTLGATAGGDDLPAGGGEAARRSLADARRGAGDEDGSAHGLLLFAVGAV